MRSIRYEWISRPHNNADIAINGPSSLVQGDGWMLRFSSNFVGYAVFCGSLSSSWHGAYTGIEMKSTPDSGSMPQKWRDSAFAWIVTSGVRVVVRIWPRFPVGKNPGTSISVSSVLSIFRSQDSSIVTAKLFQLRPLLLCLLLHFVHVLASIQNWPNNCIVVSTSASFLAQPRTHYSRPSAGSLQTHLSPHPRFTWKLRWRAGLPEEVWRPGLYSVW